MNASRLQLERVCFAAIYGLKQWASQLLPT